MAPSSANSACPVETGERIAVLETRTSLIERDLGTVGAVQIELRAVSTDVKHLTTGAIALQSDVTELRKEVAASTAASAAHVLAATAQARKKWPAEAKASLCVAGIALAGPAIPVMLAKLLG